MAKNTKKMRSTATIETNEKDEVSATYNFDDGTIFEIGAKFLFKFIIGKYAIIIVKISKKKVMK